MNYSGKNLRGRNFKGQDLTKKDFSYADIRGANFTGAILEGANFTEAKAGLQQHWAALQLTVSCFLSGMLTFAAVHLYSDFTSYYFFSSTPSYGKLASGLFILVAFVCVFSAIFSSGLTINAVPGISFAVLIASTCASLNVSDRPAAPGLGAVLVVIAVVVSVAIAGSKIGSLGVIVGTIAGVIHVFKISSVGFNSANYFQAAFLIAIIATTTLLSIYVSWQAAIGTKKFSLMRTFSVDFAAIRGTSFYKANLDKADFTAATLQSTDFRRASLTQTCWKNAKNLDRARLGNSILSNPVIRELLVTRNGYKKDYTNTNLSGANLNGVNLEGANLRRADLSNATLQKANLKDASLAETQSIATDFTSASLTGACLESWNIDHTTKLANVDCQYVFLLERTNLIGSRERRPHDPERTFEPGDFEKLYQEIINTVQILLKNGINPEAFREAFNNLMRKNPDITYESIQGIEKKGDDVVLTLEVPQNADKAKIESSFRQLYEERVRLLEAEVRKLKASHPNRSIRTPSNKLSQIIINIGDKNMSEQKNQPISTGDSSFVNNGEMNFPGSIINLGAISGNVTNILNQLRVEGTPNALELADLLKQLQDAITTDPNLPDADKTEALEQIKILAELGQNSEAPNQDGLGKRAIKILKGTVALFPSAATFIEACGKLLPLIAKLLSLSL